MEPTTFETVVGVIRKQLETDADILPSTHIENDLGADSLDCVEIIMGIEDALNITIPDEAMRSNMTVDELVGLVTDIRRVPLMGGQA